MAIQIVTDPKIAASFGVDLYGDPAGAYTRAKEMLNGSSTGRTILSKVEANPQFVINLIVTNVFPSMFMDEELNQTSVKGGVVTWSATYQNMVNGKPQQPFMGLAHELGHVVQYMNDRGWYKGYTRMYLDRLRASFDCVGAEQTKLEANAQKARDVIENDNLKLHEAPVARELGQPVRDKY